MNKRAQDESQSSNKLEKGDANKGFHGKKGCGGFIKLVDGEKQFIETKRLVLLEATM